MTGPPGPRPDPHHTWHIPEKLGAAPECGWSHSLRVAGAQPQAPPLALRGRPRTPNFPQPLLPAPPSCSRRRVLLSRVVHAGPNAPPSIAACSPGEASLLPHQAHPLLHGLWHGPAGPFPRLCFSGLLLSGCFLMEQRVMQKTK